MNNPGFIEHYTDPTLAQHDQRIKALEAEIARLREQIEAQGRRSLGIDTSPEAMERYFAPVVERPFGPGEAADTTPVKHGRITRKAPKEKVKA